MAQVIANPRKRELTKAEMRRLASLQAQVRSLRGSLSQEALTKRYDELAERYVELGELGMSAPEIAELAGLSGKEAVYHAIREMRRRKDNLPSRRAKKAESG